VQTILTIAIAVTFATSLVVVALARNQRCIGSMPSSLFAFTAILFTSGLDVGLIMFPLTEFPVYASEAAYGFTNPLAIEFGFWGFLVWGFYFLTTAYFCLVEPRLRLFDIPFIRVLNNAVIIATCAFTAYLFLVYLPEYIPGIGGLARFALVAGVVLLSVLSSTDIRWVKTLSISSTWLFFSLVLLVWAASGMGIAGFLDTASGLGGYFENLDRFIAPISDHHAFYLFWWFAWSIMIGQFVARFVGGLKTWQLLLALLVIPSIPIAFWFTVLYWYHVHQAMMPGLLKLAMVVVGVIFVINSLDSLIRLYTDNLSLTVERFGRLRYVAGNWLLMYALVLCYQFTPLRIEWIGLVVIAIYAVIYGLLTRKWLTGEMASA